VPDPPAPTPFRNRARGGAVPDAEGPTPKADSRRWPNASTPEKTVMPPQADGRRPEEVCQDSTGVATVLSDFRILQLRTSRAPSLTHLARSPPLVVGDQ
jgi:hypothetical protein